MYSTQNCILLFKELPLHLWIPTSHDLSVVSAWLINSPLTSPESLLARNILSGLNWGTKSEVCVWVCVCGVCVKVLYLVAKNCVRVRFAILFSIFISFPQEGSSELVLPWSVHCSVALAIVEAHTRHLPTQPGGRDYTPFTALGKV